MTTPEHPGPGVDVHGNRVVDPTENVRELVEAAIKRQDDLRSMEATHRRETDSIREHYAKEIREAEAARIDAIRAVDVGAVNRAAEVAATQASTLAAQVAVSAETLRNQVAAAATAQTVALAAALEPVQKDIADLRRAQYEQQGQKIQVGETQARGGNVGMWAAVLVAAIAIAAGLYAGTRSPAVVPVQPVTVTVPK